MSAEDIARALKPWFSFQCNGIHHAVRARTYKGDEHLAYALKNIAPITLPFTYQPVVQKRPRRRRQAYHQSVDGYDDERRLGAGVTKEDIDEGDDLDRLAEPHAVRQDAAQSRARAEPLQGLDDVVVQEPDTSDLRDAVIRYSAFYTEIRTRSTALHVSNK